MVASEPVDYREHPELYRVGKGEQGVLICEPYKGELVPLWRFKTPEIAAKASSKAIYRMFLAYLRQNDFVGADMARKFLQMGFTRARRYANYKGGRKYDGPVPADKKGQSGSTASPELPRDPEDPVKAESARIFKAAWDSVEAHEDYVARRAEHKRRLG